MSKILLNESDITYLVKEAVSRVLNEVGDTIKGQYRLGRLDGRYIKKMRYSKTDDESLMNAKKAGDISDYAHNKLSSSISSNKLNNPDDLSLLLKAYKLGYEDEVYGDALGYSDDENNLEFRKKYLDGVSIK
jgi:hypothetical protein